MTRHINRHEEKATICSPILVNTILLHQVANVYSVLVFHRRQHVLREDIWDLATHSNIIGRQIIFCENISNANKSWATSVEYNIKTFNIKVIRKM